MRNQGQQIFQLFKSWTFVDANNGDKALATNTVAQSITESSLLQKELEVGYDLNGDLVVGNGIFSVALLSKEYLDEISQVKKSPGVVRLSSGEFGIILEGNDYSEGDGNSFVLKELVSSGNAWTPLTAPSTQGYDYFISGAERLENNDLKIYELRESTNGDPDVKVTTFTQYATNPDSYFVKNVQSDAATISDLEFLIENLSLVIIWIQIKCSDHGAEEISISPESYTDKFNTVQKSPAVAKLADGSVAVDFTGEVQLGNTPKLLLNEGNKPFRLGGEEFLRGIYSSSEINDATNQITFNVNIVQQGSITDSEAYFLRSFAIADDTVANYDVTKALQPVSKTEILSKKSLPPLRPRR